MATEGKDLYAQIRAAETDSHVNLIKAIIMTEEEMPAGSNWDPLAPRKGGRKQNKSTELVRAYASQAGTFTTRAARDSLGLSAKCVSTAVDTLLRGKRVKRTARATYEWIREKKPARQAPLEERIWHAIRVSPKWAASDIAQLAGTTVSYVYKRMRVYRAEGFIKRCGARSVPGGSERLWKLTVEASAMVDLPKVAEYSPDPLAVMAVKLNRLVCTGLVRFVDARREALRLCGEISKALGGRDEDDGKGSEI
jgi:DNA-binding Lrp family transcriptional regulator